VMAMGVGISVRNALAVIEAVAGKQSEFVRTPKYRVEACSPGRAGVKDRVSWAKKSYTKTAGLMPYIEIALGCYFAAAVVYSIQMENYATVPFMILFVWGYLYTGVMSLAQTHIDRLFARRDEAFARRDESFASAAPAVSAALILAPAEGTLLALSEPQSREGSAEPAAEVPAPKARAASAS